MVGRDLRIGLIARRQQEKEEEKASKTGLDPKEIREGGQGDACNWQSGAEELKTLFPAKSLKRDPGKAAPLSHLFASFWSLSPVDHSSRTTLRWRSAIQHA